MAYDFCMLQRHFARPDSATTILLYGRPKLFSATSARLSPASLATLCRPGRLCECVAQSLQEVRSWHALPVLPGPHRVRSFVAYSHTVARVRARVQQPRRGFGMTGKWASPLY